MAILLGITGFYIFLSLYLLGHLVTKAVRGRRSGSKAGTPGQDGPNQKSMESLMSRIKEQVARSAES
ncbi:MAG TPA: hypothetical protein VLV83_07115 [Acidobacteriota bacterium]|nr:hypothetical protein [Acidobacteriota bacterium]